MSQEYLSIAIWEPLPGMEAASLATIRQLNAVVSNKGYGRDLLYRSGDSRYVLLRYWNSEQARRAAQEDPEVLRRWARLGNEIQILKVYEKLEEVGV
jgi:heme-degrading monooxygenase HmoA